ncbi:fumarylacetoacetate hydrolase (plasmid) [Pseudonocardia sp. EC080610-09]|uniref:fumarylacetoacetate hydrolase family protein n=1 Tax=unclassified Pseudonocardia TaxID=2619320 RepID=UPI000705E0F4|nr:MULTISPECIES: fumarylacetoacetate hydrolase family protein [unclassified Pseudonocardia]ALL79596.1 fumarylacetoacetate hydrolase [Pseudonocardia sp. EC080610-09]ALL85450.1 fumarylacetoacetate hydrolase [Pseudonocardia sp. EC080619-01]
MRYGNLAGRLAVFTDGGAVDAEKASNGRFGPDPQNVYDDWDAFTTWACAVDGADAVPFTHGELGAPVPAPAQVFAIGLNYRDHAAESKLAVPDRFPPVFTKFRSSLTGPVTTVELPPGGNTDWEVELVAIIGRRADRIPAADAWSHVAGLTAGQDLSERVGQLSGPAPQFSLGKSHRGFAPTGPWVVTVDEFDDPATLALSCAVDGETVQDGTTGDLLFGIPALIEGLSAVTPLLPGDLLFTGTPAGVGAGRTPPRFLQAGEVLTSRISGIGTLTQTFVPGRTS